MSSAMPAVANVPAVTAAVPLRVLACAVAFNEGRRIGTVLDRCREAGIEEVIVVDDGSIDGTHEEVARRRVPVIRHARQRGVGVAIRSAIHYARSHQFDVLVIMAGNGKDSPQWIPRLLEPILGHGYDFVQGSRYLPGGGFSNMPLHRRIATQFVHPVLFSLVAGRRITDSTNGFRAFRLSMLDDTRIDLDQEWLNAYELEPYIFLKAVRLGYQVTEVPVTKTYPPGQDYTKMKPVTGWWSILRPIVLLGCGLRK